MPNPHANPAASQSRFPFASRLSRQDPQAPLFYSATNDFHDEDEGDEHEREAAAFYALQRSRQHFGPSNLTDSSEVDDDAIERLQEQPEDQVHERDSSTQRAGYVLREIRSPGMEVCQTQISAVLVLRKGTVG